MDVNVLKYEMLAVGAPQWRNLTRFLLEDNGADIWMGYENAGVSLVKNFCKG